MIFLAIKSILKKEYFKAFDKNNVNRLEIFNKLTLSQKIIRLIFFQKYQIFILETDSKNQIL